MTALVAMGAIGLSAWLLAVRVRPSAAAHLGPAAEPFAPGPLALAFAMWMAMMVAMMLPAVTPWVLVLSTVASGNRSRARVAEFLTGYFGVWAAYAAVGAVLQVGLQRAGFLHADGRVAPIAGGVVLMSAGAFQFGGLKNACLAHCRSPLAFFLERWRDGPAPGWSLGFRHGLYCVGCCWALMAVVFALGVMNLLWMAAIAVLVCLEQLTPAGRRIGYAVGAAMGIWGGWLVVLGH